MSSPDRQPVPETTTPVAPLPAALREDGRDPRSRAERLLMLGTLTAISLALAIPTLVVTGIFGPRPQPKELPAADGLRMVLQQNARTLFPEPLALTPDPITVTVRPEHVATRAEKVIRQAAQFGGVATDGVPDGSERHLFVGLPAAQTAAFRRAVTNNDPANSLPSSLTAATAAGQDHVEVIIRPAGNDE